MPAGHNEACSNSLKALKIGRGGGRWEAGVEGGEDRARRREISEKKRDFGRRNGSFCGDVTGCFF
jgi:hypothetical protein